jgi:putative PIN family toxin of toxin-antitoxin system
MRIVIDTNIWVSGLLWRGLPWRLLRLAETGVIEICMDIPMLDELAEVLHYERLQQRLRQIEGDSDELVAFALHWATFFHVPAAEPDAPSLVAADPDDDIFLRCAAVANAEYVISGDHHLLALGRYADIPIVTIRDFFAQTFPQEMET